MTTIGVSGFLPLRRRALWDILNLWECDVMLGSGQSNFFFNMI
jgi:hypothetical protein